MGRAGGGSHEDASTETLRRQGTFGKPRRYCEVLKGLKGRLELVLLAANGLSFIWGPSCLCTLYDREFHYP